MENYHLPSRFSIVATHTWKEKTRGWRSAGGKGWISFLAESLERKDLLPAANGWNIESLGDRRERNVTRIFLLRPFLPLPLAILPFSTYGSRWPSSYVPNTLLPSLWQLILCVSFSWKRDGSSMDLYLSSFLSWLSLFFSSPFVSNSVWGIGIIILLISIAAAFIGYVLPWGQISYWGATVITNLLSAIPYIGDTIVLWIWGGFSINNYIK